MPTGIIPSGFLSPSSVNRSKQNHVNSNRRLYRLVAKQIYGDGLQG